MVTGPEYSITFCALVIRQSIIEHTFICNTDLQHRSFYSFSHRTRLLQLTYYITLLNNTIAIVRITNSLIKKNSHNGTDMY